MIFDWRIAIALIAVIPLFTIFGLQTIRDDLDEDRHSGHRINLSEVLDCLKVVAASRALTAIALVGGIYTFTQMAILSFIVTYFQEEKGFSTEFAGVVFAIIHGSAIPARIVWDVVASKLVSSWVLLALLGFMMSLSIIALSWCSAASPFFFIALIAVLLGASTNGVLGLFLSEFARLAPKDKVAEAVGGAQLFLFFGVIRLYCWVLSSSDSNQKTLPIGR